MAVGVVVATVRLHQALALLYEATTREATHLVGGVEGAVVGVHHCLAVYHLDKVVVEGRGTLNAVVRSAVAIGIGAILVDEHVTEALEALVGVPYGTICKDYGAVVVRGEVTHEDEDGGVALLDEVAVVGNHVYHAAISCARLRSGNGWCGVTLGV